MISSLVKPHSHKGSKMKPIYVVTIKETVNAEEDTIDVEAFRSRDAAVAWINKEISDKIDLYDLRDESVEGWRVEIGGSSHAIQYNVKECLLQ